MPSNTHSIKQWFGVVCKILVKHKWALMILIAALLVHFWYIFLHFTTSLYGGPGDHTASLIWLYEQSPNTPWWGFTNMSAAPFGEMLWSPVYLLGQAVYILFWLFSSIFQSGIGGYNALTILGYIFSFLAIYCVATKLFGRRPLVTGVFSYVGTFTPFVMALNTVGHLSYIFAPGYVALLTYLLLLVFTQKPTLKRLVLIGALSGLSWLIDPYYVLFSTILVFSLCVVLFFIRKAYSTPVRLKEFFKSVACIVGVWFLCILPLLIYSHFIATTVNTTTAIRADIHEDAQQYSARFVDFLLPSTQNPLVPESIVEYKSSTFHGADTTFTLYAGITFLIFLGASFVWYLASRQSRYKPYIVSLMGAATIILLFSLPPTIELFGIKIPGLSGLVVALTDTWRVFARIFIFAFPLLVLAAIPLTTLLLHKKKVLLTIAIGCMLVVVPLDMLYRNPFNPDLFWSMKSDISANYKTVEQDEAIKLLAEYPLREAPHYKGSLYFTAQLQHGKKIMNPMMTTAGDEAKIRRSLIDLSNPQTIPALKFLGINAIQVWTSPGAATARDISGMSLLVSDSTSSIFGKSTGELYKINTSVQAQRYVVYMKGTGRVWNDDIRNIEEQTSGDVGFTIFDLCDYYKNITCNEVSDKIRHTVEMNILNDSKESVLITLETSEGRQSLLLLPGSNTVSAVTQHELMIKTDYPIGVKNYRIREEMK